MSLAAPTLLRALLVGAGATLAIDLWNSFLKRAFGLSSLDYCLLGRWARHLAGGTLRHASIAAAPPKSWECATGWLAHYAIGLGLALVFVVIATAEWLARPTLLPALLFGVATVVFPLFVLQPALGLGVASAKTPKPVQARLKSLGTHAVFGLGLYASALAARWLAPPRP